MNFKKIFSKILASIFGIIILQTLIGIIVVILITTYAVFFKPESLGDHLIILNNLMGLFILIIGVYLGLRAHETKNLWYVVFKPTRQKVTLSFILSITLFTTLLLIYKKSEIFLVSKVFENISGIYALPLAVISYMILFYPFSALCGFIYCHKGKKLFKKSKITLLLLLILLNPFVIIFSTSMGGLYNYALMNEPCGVKIIGFVEPSAARESGMNINETIIKLDNIQTKSLKDVEKVMENYIERVDGLIVRTEKATYSVKPRKMNGKYLLGINITQEFCRRSS